MPKHTPAQAGKLMARSFASLSAPEKADRREILAEIKEGSRDRSSFEFVKAKKKKKKNGIRDIGDVGKALASRGRFE